jgi:hypothetical protein
MNPSVMRPAEGHTRRMEPRTPEQHEHDELEKPAEEARGNWVEEVLGNDWKSDGDGIYRHEPAPENPRSRPPPDPAPLTWTLDCGHEVPVLPEEQPDVPPPRPRMCLKCGKLRRSL